MIHACAESRFLLKKERSGLKGTRNRDRQGQGYFLLPFSAVSKNDRSGGNAPAPRGSEVVLNRLGHDGKDTKGERMRDVKDEKGTVRGMGGGGLGLTSEKRKTER